jgi:hypothetical protein
MKGLILLLSILGAISLIPMYRGAGHSRYDGVSFWKLLHDSTNLTPDSPFGHPHTTYEGAVRRAREAYQETVIG